MFRTLHLLAVGLIYGGLIAGGYLAYRWFYPPAHDLVLALRANQGFAQQIQGSLTGQVIRVYDGDTFQLRDDRGTLFTLTLTGLQARQGLASMTNLMNLILSNHLRFDVTYSNMPRTSLGLAYLGKTNVNLAMVAAGFATARPDYMHGLPLPIRYNLLRAARKAGSQVPEATP